MVDVGAVHSEDENRFDHHQLGGAGGRPNGISYASFGLVWQKFGKNIAGSEAIAAIVDRTLVSSIDATDNGIDLYKKIFPDVVPYCIGDFVHNLRPTWQEPVETLDARFLEVVAVARKVLEREIAHARGSVAAEVLVRAAYAEASDKRLIVLDRFLPSGETLSTFPEPLFVVFPRQDGKWNVKAIRNDSAVFKNRKDFPESWAGKRDAELAALTGIADAIFCHNGRFMAVAKSKEGALALAQLALNS